MKIEIKEKGSASFYREVISVMASYRTILKNHQHKVKNYFRQYKILMILEAVMFLALLLMQIFWGGGTFEIIVMVALAVTLVLCGAQLMAMNRLLKSFLADERTSVLTLDDNGVELRKETSQVVRIGWENLAVIKVLQESLNFVSADQTGIVIGVDARYKDEILTWMKEKKPEVEVA